MNLCNFSATATLSAGVATTVDVPIDHARDWSIVITNTGGTNAVTALTVAVSPLGTRFEAAASVSSGIPLAAGASLAAIRGQGEPVKTVRLSLTSTSGTTVAIEAVGR